jgi:hypothetical protein
MAQKTLTEIQTAESAIREKAARYEAALGEKVALETSVTQQTASVAYYEKQAVLVKRLHIESAELDVDLDAGGRRVRDIALDIFTKAAASLVVRLDRSRDALASAKLSLSRVVEELKQA